MWMSCWCCACGLGAQPADSPHHPGAEAVNGKAKEADGKWSEAPKAHFATRHNRTFTLDGSEDSSELPDESCSGYTPVTSPTTRTGPAQLPMLPLTTQAAVGPNDGSGAVLPGAAAGVPASSAAVSDGKVAAAGVTDSGSTDQPFSPRSVSILAAATELQGHIEMMEARQ